MFKRLRGTRGFTLVESILATVILGAGLIGGMMVIHNSSIASVNMDLNSIATQLANEKVEGILADSRFFGYEYLDSVENYPTENLGGDYTQFNRYVTIIDVDPNSLNDAGAGSGMKKVVVDVTWGTNDYQKVSVSTLVSNYM